MVPDHFPSFPLLPTELRLKIWDLALHNPRLLHIHCEKGTQKISPVRYVKRFTSSTPPPPLLSVNRESRYLSLEYYQLSFSVPASNAPATIYVAFDLDVIKLSEGVLGYLPQTERKLIRNLVLEVKDFAYFAHFNMDIIREMKGLKELELIAGRGELRAWDRRDIMDFLMGGIRDESERYPEWVMPRITIVELIGQEKGRTRTIEGGEAADLVMSGA